jgi:nitroreductase
MRGGSGRPSIGSALGRPGATAGTAAARPAGAAAERSAGAAAARPAGAIAMGDPPELDRDWYDAIAVRRSRRRYSDRKIAAAALAALTDFTERFRLAPGARVELTEGGGDVFTGLLDRFGGAYGRVEGAPWTAAFIGPKDSELQIGYVGEAFVLEATRLGLGTCWVAGMFDRKTAASLVKLHRGEHIFAVTPVGHPVEHKRVVERMMSTAVRSAARRQVEEIAPLLMRTSGHGRPAWPAWAVTAVEAARLAPSGANKQPWRFSLEHDALVLSRADHAYWTAPIDLGIAMLHVELGAAREGVHGAWERLEEPHVARFVPGG